MSANEAQARDLRVKTGFRLSGFLVSWEMILIYILLIINAVLMIMKPNYYFAAGTLPSIVQSGMDLSFMVLGMIFVLMLGDIDISVASSMILSAMVMGLLFDAGAGAFVSILCGLLAGTLCGVLNGVLVALLKMPAVIVTIATMLLFRGVVKIILDVNVLKNFPRWFPKLAWGNVLGIPVSLLCFLAAAAVFGVVLHKTKFGRELYMIGNSQTVAEYSGIRVNRARIIVFAVMGLMTGVSAIFFVGRMGGGVSSTMARGYELDVIAIAVLGGVSTNGGKGRIYGPVISTLIMAFLIYTLGLLGVDANSRKIMTGVILIVAVLIPHINREALGRARLSVRFGGNRNVEALYLGHLRETRDLRRQLRETARDASLPQGERAAQNAALRAKIASSRQKYRQAARSMKHEQKSDARKSRKYAK